MEGKTLRHRDRLRALLHLRTFPIPLSWFILILCILGGIVGMVFWYGPVFPLTPFWIWPFLPDCPLYTFLFAALFFALRFKHPLPRLNTIVSIGLIKYGSWTVFIWSAYWALGGSPTPISLLMSSSHLLMVIGGILLALEAQIDLPTLAISFLWFAFNDYIDYGLLYYPSFPTLVPIAWARNQALGATLALHSIGLLIALWRNTLEHKTRAA